MAAGRLPDIRLSCIANAVANVHCTWHHYGRSGAGNGAMLFMKWVVLAEMLSTNKLYNLRVYALNKKGEARGFGRARGVVFHPSKARAVGIVVKRPDAALMVKRKNRFVAMDCLEVVDKGLLAADRQDAWDSAACKRLGVDYDACILWELMPVRTVSGRELGAISDILIDEESFDVVRIDISANSVDRTLLGSSNIERSKIRGYKDGAIVVDDSVGTVEESGGVAAAAGEAWAGLKHKGTQAGKNAKAKAQEAGKEAGKAVDKGAYSLGKQLGRASHMFKDFKDEFDKASK